MSTATEVKLLTLLNVSAIKKPRSLDQPGGFRSSPSFSRTASPVVQTNGAKENGTTSTNGTPNGTPNGVTKVKGKKSRKSYGVVDLEAERPGKRRKSVVFGGEVGPSGSTFGKSKSADKGKGKATEVTSEVVEDGSEVVEEVVMEEEADSEEETETNGMSCVTILTTCRLTV